jgi:predicted phage terminase large subunit-like protein
MNEQKAISPQPGPQTDFLQTKAHIAIFGGSAGGGKSFALLLEPLYHINNPNFNAVIFRRNSVQVRNPGGLWDESYALYTKLGGHPREINLEWTFPSGFRVKFGHLENEKTVYEWQGSAVPLIEFDELVHFTEKQFWYMLSRNRSLSGVSGYIRAGCNPDVDSWVRKLIDWWIGEDGFPIRERSGVLRWFVRQNDEIIWGASREELVSKFGEESMPKSLTFIPSKVTDNKILMEKDPAYLANLKALPRVERMRLLDGNWNVRAAAGLLFQRGWFEVIDAVNAHKTHTIRYWDRAATKPNENNRDPDWTAGLKLSRLHTGVWVVEDVVRLRDTPLKVEQLIKNTASQDGHNVTICIEQDPGSSGVADAQNIVMKLAGYNVRVNKPTKDKVTRALPVSAQSEAGNIKVLRGPWNDAFFNELENFPSETDVGHDDQVDVLSGAFNETAGGQSILDVL